MSRRKVRAVSVIVKFDRYGISKSDYYDLESAISGCTEKLVEAFTIKNALEREK